MTKARYLEFQVAAGVLADMAASTNQDERNFARNEIERLRLSEEIAHDYLDRHTHACCRSEATQDDLTYRIRVAVEVEGMRVARNNEMAYLRGE